MQIALTEMMARRESDNSFKIEQISAEFRVRPQKKPKQNNEIFVVLLRPFIEMVGHSYVCSWLYWNWNYLFGVHIFPLLIVRHNTPNYSEFGWPFPATEMEFIWTNGRFVVFSSLSPEFVSNATRPNHECWNCWEYNAMKVKWKY